MDFSLPQNVHTNTRIHPAPSSIDIGVPSYEYSGRSIKLTSQLLLAPRLKKSGALPPTWLHGVDREKFTFSLLYTVTVNNDILHYRYQQINLEVSLRLQIVWIFSWSIANFISFSSLSYDRSKASSKANSSHSAIQSFLFHMRVSSPFLNVIQ
jgi:hypothetical protein